MPSPARLATASPSVLIWSEPPLMKPALNSDQPMMRKTTAHGDVARRRSSVSGRGAVADAVHEAARDVLSSAAAVAKSNAQQAEYDPAEFDCQHARRRLLRTATIVAAAGCELYAEQASARWPIALA